MREHSVDAGNADVVETLDAAAHELGGAGGLLGDRDVGGAAACDDNAALADGLSPPVDPHEARDRVVARVGHGVCERRRLFV